MTKTNAIAKIKNMAIGDITKAELEAALAEHNAKTIDEYALSFGGLIVPPALLITYKAEYAAHLGKLIAGEAA